MSPNNESLLTAYGKPFLIGSLAGSIASAITQPIDTVKVVIQNRREAAGRGTVQVNPLQVARDILSQNGVLGLYKGLDSAIMRQFIYCGIRLGLFKSLENRRKAETGRSISLWEKIQYSLIAGAVGSAIANPTDVSLIRFQSDNYLPPAERRNYKNVIDALITIKREEGVQGLWRGAVPTITRACFLNCSHLVSYNESKEALMKAVGQEDETLAVRLISSAISGVAVSVISLPFDNVKTKIMKMKPGKQPTM